MYDHLRHETPEPRFTTDVPKSEGRFVRGFRLARLSWNVIEGDRSLLALPSLMLLCYAGVAAVFLLPAGIMAEHESSVSPLIWGSVLVAYPLNFLTTFFGVAFVGVLRKRFAGEDATTSDGIAFARTRIGPIAGWALVSTIVGLAIRALERVRGGAFAARIASWILGAAWALATLLVVPVLASTDLGPIAAARESAQVVRRRFDETIAGGSIIGIAFGVLFVPVVIIGMIGFGAAGSSPGFGFAVVTVAILLGLVLVAAQFAVETVFRTALFDFATTETVRSPFTRHDLETGLRPKRRFLKRR